ncbi:MAG TPA: CHAD domain-containing protein [Candidatus Acidoferrales bacterium]|nr:CHAD domain-containing protein [Candidatus Acidoferrales bacterium]
MVLTISLPTGITAKCAGIEVWMERAAERAKRVDSRWRVDDVHDLRVALRRCRTMADALREVNPNAGWRRLKKSSRDLFHALGDLRDVQVERAWVKQLSEGGDPVRKRMLRPLARKERRYRRAAAAALDDFDAKAWRKLARRLASKAQFFPLESVVFQRLALARLNAAQEQYRRAVKAPTSAAWHRLRIGIKGFRYVVENFLPQRYEAWAEGLKFAQDMLGDVHDLDVLERELHGQAAETGELPIAEWSEKIAAERKQRLERFLARAEGPHSIWSQWRAGFHAGQVIAAARFPEKRSA